MDVRTATTLDPLLIRAWTALRERGMGYAWHKSLRRALGRWPALKRRLVYGDPRAYWTHRGGGDYFREQEGQPGRTARAQWLAARIAALGPESILEVGCGYGKQLRALRAHLDVPIVGLDYSPTQLGWARTYLSGLPGIGLVLGNGGRLPFADGSFDLVFTSAVILHNPPALAERLRREILRVARRWAVHNEDTDASYNRFGYNTAAWYAEAGIHVREAGPLPPASDDAASQFCVAEPWRR